MEKVFFVFGLLVCFITGYSQESGTFNDPRDGHDYLTVKIGNQIWMAENLAWLPLVNNYSVTSETDKQYYVYKYKGEDIGIAIEEKAYKDFGVLYNWQAAINACPNNWHLASDNEWVILAKYLTTNGFGVGGSGDDIGKSMTNMGWAGSFLEDEIYSNKDENNVSGFSALPAGILMGSEGKRASDLYGMGRLTYFWTSTDSLQNAWSRYLTNDKVGMNQKMINKSSGLSVRCLKDNAFKDGSNAMSGLDSNAIKVIVIREKQFAGSANKWQLWLNGTELCALKNDSYCKATIKCDSIVLAGKAVGLGTLVGMQALLQEVEPFKVKPLDKKEYYFIARLGSKKGIQIVEYKEIEKVQALKLMRSSKLCSKE